MSRKFIHNGKQVTATTLGIDAPVIEIGSSFPQATEEAIQFEDQDGNRRMASLPIGSLQTVSDAELSEHYEQAEPDFSDD